MKAQPFSKAIPCCPCCGNAVPEGFKSDVLDYINTHLVNPAPPSTLQEQAKAYADKVCPFIWPKNKHGEDIVQRVGQSGAPGSAKHRRQQSTIKAAYLAGAQSTQAEIQEKESIIKLLKEVTIHESQAKDQSSV